MADHPLLSATAVVASLLAAGAIGRAEEAPVPAEEVAEAELIEQSAIDALDRMGAYLRTLTAFKVTGEMAREDVLDDGRKIDLFGMFEVTARRPNLLRAEIRDDRSTREFFYDGKTFTVFAPRLGYYATVRAPGTLRELVQEAENTYGIELPLADLFHWGTDQAGTENIIRATRIGESTIHGVSCEHLAFAQDDVDWQIWIRTGDRPLPCMLVITAKDDESLPRYSARLDWNTSLPVDERMFSFVAPKNSTAIDLVPVTDQTETVPATPAE